MTVTLSRRRFIIVLVVAGSVIAASMTLAAWSFFNAHNEGAKRRQEARSASVLIARAQCAQSEVFEQAALEGNPTEQQADRIRRFFRKFNAPLNQALRLLDAEPCTKGQP